jgi:hypothetical protein
MSASTVEDDWERRRGGRRGINKGWAARQMTRRLSALVSSCLLRLGECKWIIDTGLSRDGRTLRRERGDITIDGSVVAY